MHTISSSKMFVVASRLATSPVLTEIFLSPVTASAAAAALNTRFGSNFEPLPLDQAFALFNQNARADEQYVMDAINSQS